MNIIITETGQTEQLQILDLNGTDWTQDLLGNNGWHKDADTDAVTMTQEDFEWWGTYIEGHMATENEIKDLADEAGVDFLETYELVIRYMTQGDMEDERNAATDILDTLRIEHGVTE